MRLRATDTPSSAARDLAEPIRACGRLAALNAERPAESLNFMYPRYYNGAMSKVFIIIGLLLVVIGVVVGYAPWLFAWFGKLPGDIRIERENGVFFFPLTSMVVVSVVVSLLLSLFFRR
jgi:hypothetical protein